MRAGWSDGVAGSAGAFTGPAFELHAEVEIRSTYAGRAMFNGRRGRISRLLIDRRGTFYDVCLDIGTTVTELEAGELRPVTGEGAG